MTNTTPIVVREDERLRVALVADLREFAADFGSSTLRMGVAWKVMVLLSLGNEVALSTAILLGGTRIVDKGTNWMSRTRRIVIAKIERR